MAAAIGLRNDLSGDDLRHLARGSRDAKQVRRLLARVVEAGPEPWRDGVVRWRRIDLVQWLWEEFRVSVSEATVGRELRALGFRKLSARPRHYAQDPEVAEAFKNVWPAPSAS